MENTTLSLKKHYELFKAENPKVRVREAARSLGVTEVELVAVGDFNTELRPDFEEILKAVPALGHVMALTRNEHAVHERKGTYSKLGFNDGIGLVVNPDIDLRFFMEFWGFVFSVVEGERRSLQFFGKDGSAIHKIYLTDRSDVAAFDDLETRFRTSERDLVLELDKVASAVAEKEDREIDVSGFRQAWLDLKDTHDFFGLLGDYGLTRRQAMRLAPDGYAQRISIASMKRVLEGVSGRSLEIMVFIGNPGCIQIHTGHVNKLLQTGPWFNVLDPEFNMHLREDAVESVWLVRKPTADGIVTSLEAFDSAGQVVVQFFGKRKPRTPEQEAWRQVLLDYAHPV